MDSFETAVTTVEPDFCCCCVPILLTTFPAPTSAERIHSRDTGAAGGGGRASVQTGFIRYVDIYK